MNTITAVLACALATIMGVLCFEWSFTETTFGGYVGAASGPLACMLCFALGRVRGAQ